MSKPKRQAIIPIGPSIAYVPITKGLFALIDAEDVQRVCAYNWCAHKDAGKDKYYAYRSANSPRGQHRSRLMHVFICGHVEGKTVDHIYPENGLDNRKGNLRHATVYEQMFNMSMRKDNTSGVKGVYYLKLAKQWRAQITAFGTRRYLGNFRLFEDAVAARARAAEELHGDFRRDA